MMKRIAITILLLLAAAPSWAGLTQTLPAGTFMLDESIIYAQIENIWDNGGKKAPIIEEIERYEPGTGQQGVLIPDPRATYTVWIQQLQYGVTDTLSLAVGLPIVLKNTVDPRLGWEEGDYQNRLGRPYSEEDFWQWAETLGQSKIEPWTGNEGTPGDTVLGSRWRYSDGMRWFEENEVSGALSLFALLPTGENADPEEIVGLGTTMWDLHTMGDVGLHASFEKKFPDWWNGRSSLSLDLFYEHFFVRTLDAPKGVKDPLLLTYEPYIGKTYDVKPGDFSGFALQWDCAPWVGPVTSTWLAGGDLEKAQSLPPLLSAYLQYRFVHLQQTDWRSDSALWDWEKEKYWRPGYKNFLIARLTASFLRLGAPLQAYVHFSSLTLIPGRNARAADVISGGLQIFLKFW